MLGRGTDAEPVFVTVCLPGIFSCRNPGCCLGCWNHNFQPALALFFSMQKSVFVGIEGKPAWNFILSLLPLCIRECQFSVVGVKECKHV